MKVASITTPLLAAAALAEKHHRCNCCVGGKIYEDYNRVACEDWSVMFPNSHWDDSIKACVDPGTFRGIDWNRWSRQCRKIGVDKYHYPYIDIHACC
ncbi:uncharacterized protein UV8b_04724 [Ustilaginoidea virens]|uniref:Uncharacterized protein n=1 Tax=Ustilaginoidea virens TaxID=1159556 RepID=A0A8E5HSC7_USTVR|nr:uncharacterized protein UV8b_04724 [Ustilaginoidea virens]QUC20483.1 hypothetical protein UV8b_04724 [Ustilaginoidea virens]